MASIKSIMQLEDRMSQQLKLIARNLDYVNDIMKDTDRLSGEMFKVAQGEIDAARSKLQKMGADIESLNTKTKGLKSPIRDTTAEFEKMRLKISDIANYALGNLLAGAASQLLTGIKNTVVEAVGYASDLKEIQNVVDVTFASSADKINQWSETALESYGLSELAAKNYASTMGSMLKASGLTEKEVTDMSIAIAGLAGDVASFRNLKPDEAFQKLTSIVSGETKPMRALGVNMTVANLEAYALAKGINKTWNEMSQAEQVTLRYNYVMELLKDVQGDFARTSGTYANQQKLLSENWKQFTATIATYVLPVLELLLQGLNTVVSFLTDHADTVGVVLLTLTAILGVLGAKALWAGAAHVIAGAQAAIAWVGALWPIIAVIGAIGLLIAILVECGVSFSQIVGFIAGLLGALYAYIYNHVVMLYNLFGAFGAFLFNVFVNPIAAIKMLFYDLAITVIGYIRSIAQAIEDVINAIPFVEVSITSGMDNLLSNLKDAKKELAEEENLASFEPIEYKNIGDTFSEWSGSAQAGLENLGNLGKYEVPTEWSSPDIGTLGNDNNIDKVGKVGKIEDDVSITDEDIELLKDVATVDYVNKFVTMNPNMTVQFGDVHETADINEITSVMADMIKEAAATALV